MNSRAVLTQAIKAEARRLGFPLVGVTTPDPPPHLEVFERWLQCGRHGTMDYLATERARRCRADPRRILPECRSILVLGAGYPSPASSPLFPAPLSLPLGKDRRGGEEQKGAEEGGQGWGLIGRVASYAWGEDYHLVLPKRLQTLAVFIEREVGEAIPHRWYTDTGPLLERELAQRAGLGWIGKNTCLINPQAGSYFFLAEILLGIELEADFPFTADRCGSCTRCRDACPTGCILPDRTLDAARCISYLTIELKSAVPPDLRPLMGNWVFGCDLCQQVCPWNRFAAPQGDAAFAPRAGVPAPDLLAELQLSSQEFNRKFKDSALQLAKRRGYLRNVAIALGNLGDETAIPALTQSASHDPEPLVRAHAAWAREIIFLTHARMKKAVQVSTIAAPEAMLT